MSYIHWLREKGYRVPPGTVLEPDEQEEEIEQIEEQYYDLFGVYMDELNDDKVY